MIKLRELRKQKKLTGQAVADALGIERSLYVRYENGTRTPPLDNLILMADFFGVSIDCLVGRGEEGKTDLAHSDDGQKKSRITESKKDQQSTVFSPEQQLWLKSVITETVENILEDTKSRSGQGSKDA